MSSGVYTIFNLHTGIRYIGCSSSIETRVARHFHQLVDRQHPNWRLQQMFNLDPEAWRYAVLEFTYRDNMFEREQVWFDRMIHHLVNLDLSPLPDTTGNSYGQA